MTNDNSKAAREAAEDLRSPNLWKRPSSEVIDGQCQGGGEYEAYKMCCYLYLAKHRQTILTALEAAAMPKAVCEDCQGAGEIFTHRMDCHDDLCALNGDIHSCTGVVIDCPSCTTPPPVPQMDLEELTQEIWDAVHEHFEEKGKKGLKAIISMGAIVRKTLELLASRNLIRTPQSEKGE